MVQNCVCCSKEMTSIWSLPSLPLTGIYVEKHNDVDFENFHDQELLYCHNCSHLQLSNPVDAELLYSETYSHRTGLSPISSDGNVYFESTLRSWSSPNRRQILEIGCNDGTLLQAISDMGENLAGFDPVIDGVHSLQSNITLMGAFGENVDYSALLDTKVDLLLSAHTFEHIVDPKITMERVLPWLDDNCEAIIEVPSSITMTELLRLDQVFPQHVNIYSPKSIATLMRGFGFSFSSVVRNKRYWGGTQILHFVRGGEDVSSPQALELSQVEDSISAFRSNVELVKSLLRNRSDIETYALGAAQMLPIIAYHLGYDFFEEHIAKILDDDPRRQGRFFPHLECPIEPATLDSRMDDFRLLITAPDSSKKLISRSLELDPIETILPFGIV